MLFDSLLVDGGTARRGWEAGGGDRAVEKSTGAMISYFVGVLLRLRHQYAPGQLVVCWDAAGSHKLRTAIDPAYKAQRQPASAGFIAAMEELREHLPDLGVAQAVGEQGEADDLLYTLATSWPGRIGVYSVDKDMLQIAAEPGVTVIKPDLRRRARGEYGEYLEPQTPPQLVTAGCGVKMGGVVLPVEHVHSHLVLMGDAADGIPGLKGCGERTSARLLAACPEFVALVCEDKWDVARDMLMEQDKGLVKWAARARELQRDLVVSSDLVRLYEVGYDYTPGGWDPGAAAAWAGQRRDTAWIAERIMAGKN